LRAIESYFICRNERGYTFKRLKRTSLSQHI